MTSFQLGFIKYAEECGLSSCQAAHMLKRSEDHPAVQDMFKNLPGSEPEQQSPEDLDLLNNMLQQDLIDQQLQQKAKALYM